MNKFIIASILLLISACTKETELPVESCQVSEIPITPEHELGEELQKLLEEYVQKGLPGVVGLVFTPEHGLWIGAAGMSRLEDQTPMQSCQLFHSASVAKTYMATLTMMLVEEGKIDLDQTVDRYLNPDLIRGIANTNTATVRQLMNHSSGIVDFIEATGHVTDYYHDILRTFSTEDYLDYIRSEPAEFEAGQRTSYCNTNTVLLALILDQLSGQSHANLITERIINKLGLKQTFYKNEAGYPSPPGLVNTYLDLYGDGVLVNSSSWERNFAAMSIGHDGMIASAHDYYQFIRALFEGELVNQSSLNSMMESFTYSFGSYGHGLGLEISTSDSWPDRFGHNGGSLGAANEVFYYPEKGTFIVLCSNFGDFLPSPLGRIFHSSGLGVKGTLIGSFERLLFGG